MIGTMNRIAGITALNGKIKVGMAWGARPSCGIRRCPPDIDGERADALDAASPAWVGKRQSSLR